jgi:hypothetical protein
MYTKEQIEKALKSKGYSWFDGKKDYDLNIVGIRNNILCIVFECHNERPPLLYSRRRNID